MMARVRGFTLPELLLAMALGAVILAGLVTVVSAVLQTVRAQQALAGVAAVARFATSDIGAAVAGAGFGETPWSSPGPPALDGSIDALSVASDQLVLRRRARTNCLGNDNPAPDATGAPAAWLREEVFSVRDGWRLVKTCHYGPGPGAGTRQLNAATLVEGVEAFQARFGEDRNDDGAIDRWVDAGAWSDETRVLGVRVALLIASPESVRSRPIGRVRLLGQTLSPPDDGRVRLVVEETLPIRGRLP